MWYIILGLLLLIYLLIHTIIPSLGSIGSYILQPILWLTLGFIVFLSAQREELNILVFKRIRRWYLGNSPIQAGLLLGGFQVAMLIIAGLFSRFGKSPYSFTPIMILTNLFFVSSTLIGIEFTRSYLINRSITTSKKHLTMILLFSTILFMFIEISPSQLTLLSFSKPVDTLEFLGTLVASLSIGILASYLSYLGGATAAISYIGMLKVFEWFSPVLPDLHWTINALIGTIAPAIGFIVIQNSIYFPEDKRERRKRRRESRNTQGNWVIVAIVSLLIVFFSFGYLGAKPTIISSGSMTPTIQVGDIALIEKQSADNVKIGDIIQYVSPYDNRTLIVHRLIDIQEKDGKTLYITKGDANEDPDNPITGNRIIGKSVFIIPKIGWIPIFIKIIVKSTGLPI